MVYNWYTRISSNIMNLIEIDVKKTLKNWCRRRTMDYGKFSYWTIWRIRKYRTSRKFQTRKEKEPLYKLTILRISNLCNIKSFSCEFDKYYYELYYLTENREPYIQLLLNKFPNPWNRYFSEKSEEFARQPTTFRSVAAVQTINK